MVSAAHDNENLIWKKKSDSSGILIIIWHDVVFIKVISVYFLYTQLHVVDARGNQTSTNIGDQVTCSISEGDVSL